MAATPLPANQQAMIELKLRLFNRMVVEQAENPSTDFQIIWYDQQALSTQPQEKARVEDFVRRHKDYKKWEKKPNVTRAIICAPPHTGGSPNVDRARHDKRRHVTVRICKFGGPWSTYKTSFHVVVPPAPRSQRAPAPAPQA